MKKTKNKKIKKGGRGTSYVPLKNKINFIKIFSGQGLEK
jgi:hypothetical protein